MRSHHAKGLIVFGACATAMGLFALSFIALRRHALRTERDVSLLGEADDVDAHLHGESDMLTEDEQVDLASFDSFPASAPPGKY